MSLCNLHNEVFEVAGSRINTEYSLTTSEGISSCVRALWGQCFIPSLQVRVYHFHEFFIAGCYCSLTTSEGISCFGQQLCIISWFPHYT